MKIINGQEEVIWDTVCWYAIDFRPHFNGDLINISSCVHPLENVEKTKEFMINCFIEIAKWILENKKMFSPEDKFQIIIGWPLSIRNGARQVIKMCEGFDNIPKFINGDIPIEFRRGWDTNVFKKNQLPKAVW